MQYDGENKILCGAIQGRMKIVDFAFNFFYKILPYTKCYKTKCSCDNMKN